MRPQTMAAAFASVQTVLDNCKRRNNAEWAERWRARLVGLLSLIPHGSGIDSGPDCPQVTPTSIRFGVGFHHMDDHGFYDGWTHHTITVRPAFDGVDVRVSGPNRRDVKDHLHEAMEHAFTRHVVWDEPAQRWVVESDDERYAAMERAYPRAKVESAEVRP